uniref:RING-type domain-containing protein n=1 Tax=Oryza punctata TaxID=4537 RepID=A0A0E0KGV7_ORYPU
MDSDAALHVELVGVVAVGTVVVVLAAAVSGACGRRKRAQVDDVESALGGAATVMTYEQALAAAKKTPSSSPVAGPAAEGADSCAICLDEHASADVVRVLPACGHFFHKECIDHWVEKYQRRCPLCRGWLSSLPPLPKPGCRPMPPRMSRPAASTATATAGGGVVV